MVPSPSDLDWGRRSQLLNSCLLTLGITLAAVVLAGVGVRFDQGRLIDIPLLPALVLMLGGGWLLAAYVCSRLRRFNLAGWLVVAFVLVTLALALYVLPLYYPVLLPYAALPIALAALLLHRRAIYATLLLTLGVVLAVPLLAAQLPPPALGISAPGPLLSAGIAIVALCFLGLALVPLRNELTYMTQQVRQHEAARLAAVQEQQLAEQSHAAALTDLAVQQQNAATVMQHSSDGVIAVNSAGKVVRANAMAGSIWSEIAGGDLVGQRLDQVRAMLMGPTATTHFVDMIELPASDSPGPEDYSHLLLDRRERARLTRLRGELLGLLADEMRNPLTSMVTALEMTLGQNLPEGADRVLVGARRSGQRLLELVTTLLDINQLEHNPAALRRAPTTLRPILDAGIAQTTPFQHQGAVQVVVEYNGDGVVLADSERVRRAFVHLLEHALRQSPPYSTVQVRTEYQSDVAVVRISDQGPGLTLQQRELLFEQRVSPDERKAPALGLAFSKLVFETHGGHVLVESNGSNGSTYAFTLPIDRHAEV